MINSNQHQATDYRDWSIYGLIFTAAWLLLTKGNLASWVIGAIVVPLATWSAVKLLRPTTETKARLSLIGLLRFLPFFVWQSLRGGWDSAVFAIHPNKPVKPTFFDYQTQLPSGRPQIYFLHTVSLLPGTVSAALSNGKITIHALDANANHQQALADCERRIQDLFDIPHPKQELSS